LLLTLLHFQDLLLNHIIGLVEKPEERIRKLVKLADTADVNYYYKIL